MAKLNPAITDPEYTNANLAAMQQAVEIVRDYWEQGTLYGVDPRGKPRTFCAVGAVAKVENVVNRFGMPDYPEPGDPLVTALYLSLPKTVPVSHLRSRSDEFNEGGWYDPQDAVINYNDADNRTNRQVVSWFKRAHARMQNQITERRGL